ncbi:MAG: tetratricopeptide repeat protein [Flavobacteriaceae bacterium]|nr:tetratricopeptide repeat protein [Flavobacteriaceae bacterium]
MKNQFLLGLMFLATLTAVGQKNELKATAKALKSGDIVAAKSAITQAEALIANADNKLKAKFYFLKGKTYAEIAKKQISLDKNAYDIAAKSFTDLIAFEKKVGRSTYTKEAAPLFNALIADLKNIAVKQYNSKDYRASAINFNKIYEMSPLDTFMLDNAANAAHLAKDFKLALGYYVKLNDLGYTGVSTEYTAKSVETGKYETFTTKSERDLMVKVKKYTDPKDKTSDSRSIAISKNIAYLYSQLGENGKGLEVLKKARELAPDDYNLLLAEADLQIKMGNRDKFGELMNLAIKKNPDNPVLYFNLGVINSEQNKDEEAIKYYKKAIELKADYFDAYINLASVLRKDESKIIDEMNNSLSDFDKYDQLKAKLSDLYKVVLPYYEKAYGIKNDDISIIQTLMGIYENLEMDDKYKTLRASYDLLRGK